MTTAGYDFSVFESSEKLERARFEKEEDKKIRKKKIREEKTYEANKAPKEMLDKYRNAFFDLNNNVKPLKDLPTLKSNSNGPSIKEIMRELNLRPGSLKKNQCIEKILECYGYNASPPDPLPATEDIPASTSLDRKQKENLLLKYARMLKVKELTPEIARQLSMEDIDLMLQEYRKALNIVTEQIAMEKASPEALRRRGADFLAKVITSGGYALDGVSPYVGVYTGYTTNKLGEDFEKVEPEVAEVIEEILVEEPEWMEYLTPRYRLAILISGVIASNVTQATLKKKAEVSSVGISEQSQAS